ncbi:uncharacterized protein LOC113493227 isoform X2 [Trichoplusia ni]|uniref:Uncharacterized protein LOC113493227 isoform X2 n=1 Tax=Trichoplusia ni TaxID=7111 RepID=A0A7E5VF07_TRINI|nr:uncharacterized protein LOC113493227 isoform X2 [Trichoplusia ni]
MTSSSDSETYQEAEIPILTRRTMESILRPPQPFIFENDITNVTSGNLSKEWEKWKKAFKIYYEACELHSKENIVQINILLHIIGEKCREVYEQFTGEYKTIEDLLKAFDAFFLPRKNITIERHSFFTRDQRDLESIEQYVFELNKIAAKCEFKDLCSELVRDKMICGIKDGGLRERLLREPDLSLSKAIDICRLAEISRAQAKNIKSENQEQSHNVHTVSKKEKEKKNIHYASSAPRYNKRRPTGSSGGDVRASRHYHEQSEKQRSAGHEREYQEKGRRLLRPRAVCGKCGKNHEKYKCPAYGQRCSACRKMNHYSRMCRVYEVQEDSSDQDSETT